MNLAKKFIHSVIHSIKTRKKTAGLFSIAFVCVFIFFINPLFPFMGEEQKQEPQETLPTRDLFQEEPALSTATDPECIELSYKPLQEFSPPEPEVISPEVDDTGKPVWDPSLVDRLSFLSSPIPGAGITIRDSQLPGAPRPYRNGTHEGLDYYDGFSGVQVRFGDPIYAAGDGTIYRIDHEYSEPGPAARQEIIDIAHNQQDTPEDILDKLRGRQVWIEHEYGVITRYAHMHEIAEHLEKGDSVETGDFIGTIGNSGTSDGARGSTLNAHLHFEIWLEDYYLGQGLAPAEVRKLWQTVLE